VGEAEAASRAAGGVLMAQDVFGYKPKKAKTRIGRAIENAKLGYSAVGPIDRGAIRGTSGPVIREKFGAGSRNPLRASSPYGLSSGGIKRGLSAERRAELKRQNAATAAKRKKKSKN